VDEDTWEGSGGHADPTSGHLRASG
jgi:hypothetical protein